MNMLVMNVAIGIKRVMEVMEVVTNGITLHTSTFVMKIIRQSVGQNLCDGLQHMGEKAVG